MGIILASELKRHGCEITSVPITKVQVMDCNKVSFRAHRHLVCHERQTSRSIKQHSLQHSWKWLWVQFRKRLGASGIFKVSPPERGRNRTYCSGNEVGRKMQVSTTFVLSFLLPRSIICEHHNFTWALPWRSEGTAVGSLTLLLPSLTIGPQLSSFSVQRGCLETIWKMELLRLSSPCFWCIRSAVDFWNTQFCQMP